MRQRMKRVGQIAMLLALLAACATKQAVDNRPVSGPDRKLSTYAYIEEGRIATLIVGTRAARDKDGQPYIPLEIAIANHGLRQLVLTRESFTLIDEDGNRYPVATPQELLAGYPMLDFDRNLAELESIVFNRFGAMPRYPSNFSPSMEVGVRSNLVRDMVSLPKHGYLIDWLFFPAPKTGIRDHAFELFVDTRELEDPIFVRFEVR